MICLVNYADHRMSRSQQVCSDSSLKYGVEKVHQLGPDDIDREFWSLNREVLSMDRGAGYWLWKPYIVHRVMDTLRDGDILIYADSGLYFINDVKHIIGVMDQDVFLFTNGMAHEHWCKMDVIKAIIPDVSCGDQVQASVVFFRVSDESRRFVREWLRWCQVPGFIDDSPSKVPNHPEFREHRHDQAILTCLQIKYGYKLHWWADGHWFENQRHRWPQDRYPAVIYHHRMRNDEW